MPTVRMCTSGDCARFDQATEFKRRRSCGEPTEWRALPILQASHTTAPTNAAPAMSAPRTPLLADQQAEPQVEAARRRGWYLRPGDPAGVQRWYDGARWTDQLSGGDAATRAQAPSLSLWQPPTTSDHWRLPISPTTPPAGSPLTELAPSSRQTSGAPGELLIVCALMSLAAVLLLWPALQVLPGAFRVMGAGALGRAIGLLALDLALIVLGLGIGLLILAWRLVRGDRVARGLSYIVLGGYSFAVVVGNDHSVGLIVTMLLCLAAISILGASPNVRRYFADAGGGPPVSVTIVRTLFAAFAYMMLLFGISYLPAGALGGKYVFAGLLLLAAGAGMFSINRRLADGSPGARIGATILMAAYTLLVLIAGGRAPATLVGLGFAAAAVGLLWVPQDAQRHFAR